MALSFRHGRPGAAANDDETPMYNPERDIAYITPTLIYNAIRHLDQENWSGELKDWIAHNNMSEAEIGTAVTAYALAQREYVSNTNPVDTPGDALARHEFFAQPYVVRQLVFAALGEVLTGAYFMAVRDVTLKGQDTPRHRDVAEFIECGLTVARRLLKFDPVPSPSAVELNDMTASLANAQARIAALEKDLAAAWKIANRERNDRKAVQHAGLWTHLKIWWNETWSRSKRS